MRINPKYELVILVVSGDHNLWKDKTGAGNIFSTDEKVFIGSEGSFRFIITWDVKTFLGMADDKLYYLIQSTMKQIKEGITKNHGATLELVFRTINLFSVISDADREATDKFDRVMRLM